MPYLQQIYNVFLSISNQRIHIWMQKRQNTHTDFVIHDVLQHLDRMFITVIYYLTRTE
jgi:hypothetical protein